MEHFRKRLLYKACHRGMVETDTIIGGFAKAKLDQMTEPQLQQFDSLLDQLDIDLFNWIMGRQEIPEAQDCEVFHMIIDFKESQ